MEIITTAFTRILEGLPLFAIGLVGLFLIKLVFQKTIRFQFDNEITEKDNPAFGVMAGGYLIGAGISLTTLLIYSGDGLAQDIQWASLGILATALLMRLSLVINDKAILHKFSIVKEISVDRNLGTAFVIAGGCIATGFMMNGMLSGDSDSFLLSFRDIAIYWMIGQLMLVLGGWVFTVTSSYDVHKTIEQDDNIPAGISFGGFLVAIGLIARNALIGTTSDLGQGIINSLIFGLAGIILLIPTTIIADKILLHHSSLRKEVVVDKNPAAGVIAAASYIIVALIYIAAIRAH